MMLIAEAYFNNGGIKGDIYFTQTGSEVVRVDIRLTGVPDGMHGISIYQNKVTNDRYETAGEHFNGSVKNWSPQLRGGTPHGSHINRTDRHIGDLCNNIKSIDGNVNYSYIDQLISLHPDSPNYIIGRSVLIHEDHDDEGLVYNFSGLCYNDYYNNYLNESKISGNTGDVIAYANIYSVYRELIN